MTGIDLFAPAPPRRRRSSGYTLPTSRGGLAWLAVLLLVGAFVAFQVGREVYASWSIGQEADQIRADMAAMAELNAKLQRELEYVQSDAYLSVESRKLGNLGYPGERVLIIPPGSEARLPATLQERADPPPPLLDQWLELFFGS